MLSTVSLRISRAIYFGVDKQGSFPNEYTVYVVS